MTADNSSTKKQKLRRMSHLLAGFIILLHAFERWEHGHTSFVFFLIAGIVFLSIAVFHHRLQARFPLVDASFFLIEASLSFIIAYEYIEAGKKALPVMYLLAGCMQIVAIVVLRKRMR